MTLNDLAAAAPRRLLLVEDDERIRTEVAAALQTHGFEVVSAGSLATARSRLHEWFDAVLLDRGLPDGDGLQLCRDLRARGAALPILVLTARDAADERVRGIEDGADDYLTKPFHLPEVLARVRRLLLRAAPRGRDGLLRLQDLWLDPVERRAGRGRTEVFTLTPREFDLLAFLMRNPGRTWTRDQLLGSVWGPGYGGSERVVDLHVARVRLAIEHNPRDPQHLETVWGVGYRFREAL